MIKKVQITKAILRKAMDNPRYFVKMWVEKNNKTAKELASIGYKSTIILDYLEYYAQFEKKGEKIKKISEKTLEHALVEYIYQTLDIERQEASSIIYAEKPNTDLSELEKFVDLLSIDNKELSKTILAHWLWSVKRKGKGLRVIHHIMPIIVGNQGGGKTIAITNLLRPILSLTLKPQLEDIADTKHYEAYSENLVAFCDELQGIDKADMNSLKLQITTEYNTFRRLFTTQSVQVPMRVSFIGASNKPINESIFDTTGMRRFFQINAPAKLDWVGVEKIDYLKIWKGIDETLEKGYLVDTALEKAREYQETFTQNNEFQTFLSEFNILQKDDNFKVIKLQELYDVYRQWAMKCGYNCVNKQWYTIKLRNLGLSTYVSGNKTYCKINPECDLTVEGSIERNIIPFKKESI